MVVRSEGAELEIRPKFGSSRGISRFSCSGSLVFPLVLVSDQPLAGDQSAANSILHVYQLFVGYSSPKASPHSQAMERNTLACMPFISTQPKWPKFNEQTSRVYFAPYSKYMTPGGK